MFWWIGGFVLATVFLETTTRLLGGSIVKRISRKIIAYVLWVLTL